MELIVVSVRDAKAESFGRPFFTQSIGIAIRSFDDEVNRVDPDNTFHNHSEDFGLYQLGYFDDNTGAFNTITPKLLVQGNEVKKALATVHKISKV